MKKILEIVLVYLLGVICVFTISWRQSQIDKRNNALAVEYNNTTENVYNY